MTRSKQILWCLTATILIGVLGVPQIGIGESDAHFVTAAPVGQGRSGDVRKQSESTDLRPVFQNMGLAARLQGKRNTCSVFVVTAAIEYALAIRQQHATQLSAEFLNWAANQMGGRAADGGFFSDLWRGYTAYGICPEADMQYLDHFDATLKPGEKAMVDAGEIRMLGLQLHWIKEWDPRKGLTDEQLAEIKRTLQKKWPVGGGFLWPKQSKWEKNVLQIVPRDAVRDGHSVLLVGFRDDKTQPGGGVFLIRNSGTLSLDGMLTYEYVQTYMNDAVWIEGGMPGR